MIELCSDSDINCLFLINLESQLHFVGGIILPTWNSTWLPAAILKNRSDVITLPSPPCVWTIEMKFGTPMQHAMLMTMNGSKSKPEVELQCGGCPFSEPEVVITQSRGLRYFIEIWYENRFRHYQTSAVSKTKTGSRFPTLWSSSWKIDRTS